MGVYGKEDTFILNFFVDNLREGDRLEDLVVDGTR
jgi:hypothetical protein